MSRGKDEGETTTRVLVFDPDYETRRFASKRNRVVNEIAFIMKPSPESNDHQVHTIIDFQDIIMHYGEHSLGIDPPDFLSDRALLDSGELTFARCSRGVVGCDDARVRTSRDESTVTWKLNFEDHRSSGLTWSILRKRPIYQRQRSPALAGVVPMSRSAYVRTE